ncbi:MAG: DUF3096 domain-containing protein [Anaerolineae bacterium]
MDSSYGLSPVARISRDLRDVSWLYIVQGIALVILGVLILIFPELLSILVAAFLLVGGGLTVATGWRMRRARKAFDELSRLLLG